MMDPHKLGHSGLDWEAFESYMNKQIPFMKEGQLKGMVKHFFDAAPGLQPFRSRPYTYEQFETHRSVLVRFKLAGELSPYDLRLSVGKRKLKIAHDGRSEQVTLPCEVNPDRARAEYAHRVLELRLPKAGKNEPWREIPIYQLKR